MKRLTLYLFILSVTYAGWSRCVAQTPVASVGNCLGFGIFDTSLKPQPDVWHKLFDVSMRAQTDSIPCADCYTLFAVVRNPEPDSAQWLWCFAEDDTIVEAVHTQGVYKKSCGVVVVPSAHDFSRWSIYRYFSGCSCDSSLHRSLSLCSHEAFVKDSAFADSILSGMEMVEAAYFSGGLSVKAGDMFQTYLSLKYGITLDYAPYLSCTGDTLWHPDRDATWYHRIIGIGYDTARSWYADLSVSMDSAVFVLSADSLIPGEYVLMGDNDGSCYPSTQADGSFRLEREWLLRPHLRRQRPIRLILPYDHVPDMPGDSLWLMVSDTVGMPLYLLPMTADSSDSMCVFTLPAVGSTPLLLSLWGDASRATRRNKTKQSDSGRQSDGVWYNTQSGMIEAGVQLQGKPLTALLYDSSGKLISALSAYAPLPLSLLPGNVCHVEIVADGSIVGNITLPINR